MWRLLLGVRANVRTRHHNNNRHPHEPAADAARVRLHTEDTYVHVLLRAFGGACRYRRGDAIRVRFYARLRGDSRRSLLLFAGHVRAQRQRNSRLYLLMYARLSAVVARTQENVLGAAGAAVPIALSAAR